ncbi:MAG: co-chaperone GroES [Bacteroidota bacterium]
MNKLSVKPVLDRIIIKQAEGESEIANLLIPDSERVKPCKGTVVAVGPGWRTSTTGELVPMTAQVGDEVIYSIHSATTVEINGVDYVLVKEGDLLVIL